MADFQPPPTYTSPIIVNPTAEREEDKVAFSSIWLNWFLQLAGIINSLGAGGGIPISSLDPSGGAEDQVIKINAALTGFDFASPGYTPFMLAARAFGRPLPYIPGVSAGSGVTISYNGSGYVISATGSVPADADTLTATQSFLRHLPRLPEVQAGTDISITQNALGPVIAASTTWASDQNVLANQIFGG